MRYLLIFLLLCGCCPKQDITNNTLVSIKACMHLCYYTKYIVYTTDVNGNLTSCECKN